MRTKHNHYQIKTGGETISASVWLKAERLKYAICPHKLDYCDTCSKIKAQTRQHSTIFINQDRRTEDEIKHVAFHRNHAQKSYKNYNNVIKQCKVTSYDHA